MAVRIVIAVTDRDWHAHLRALPGIAEANFWSPSPRSFQALKPGEFFLFKLKAPIHKVVGGGVFAHAADMASSLAWEAFGESNGPPPFWRCAAASRATVATSPGGLAIS